MSKLKNISVLGVCLIFIAFVNANELENILLDVDDNRLSNYDNEVPIEKIIDDNLDDIQHGLQSVDPFKMPDIPLQKKGELTNGLLHNLSQLKRTGECSIRYSEKVLTLTVNVGWTDLAFDYDYRYKLWFINRKGKLHGGVSKVNVALSISVDFNHLVIALQKLELTEVGKIKVKVEGSFGDEIRTLLAKLILKIAKKPIVSTIEKVANKAVNQVIEEINSRLPHHRGQFTFVDLTNTDRRTHLVHT